jgi:hypothetical protein
MRLQGCIERGSNTAERIVILRQHRILPYVQAIVNSAIYRTLPDNVYHRSLSFDFFPDLTSGP